jgi:asparagine synthase (glutamine-hydrolysing)
MATLDRTRTFFLRASRLFVLPVPSGPATPSLPRRIVRRLKRTFEAWVDPRRGERVLDDLPAAEQEVIRGIRSRRLTYLSARKLVAIARACDQVSRHNVPGAFVEAGCALGGSSILIAKTKPNGRPLHVYDVFGMIPAPTADDTPEVHERYQVIVEGKSRGIGGDLYYGYQPDLYDIVLHNFRRFDLSIDQDGIHLHRGLVQDTLQLDEPIALAHIDVDWYEPVKVCLERLFPRLSVGGMLILDDYYDWGGCRKATDEYLRTVEGQVALDDSAGSLIITKVR